MAVGAIASRTISAARAICAAARAVDLGLVGVDDAAAAVDAALGHDVDAGEAFALGDAGDRPP